MPSVKQQWEELVAVATRCRALIPAVEVFLPVLYAVLKRGGRVLTCGNGGSAADAQHLAEELSGRYRGDRQPFSGICLAADASALTCIANDYGYEQVFSRQVEAHGRQGDLLIGFSTSGQSLNVLRALQAARARGMTTVGLLGKTGGAARAWCDHAFVVPSDDTARIQEMHGWLLHVFLEYVEEQEEKAGGVG